MRLVVLGFVLAACTNTALPTPTQAVCPDPDPGTLTWESFGQQFMAGYCTMCHATTLMREARNGAPILHDFDTLEGVLRLPGHIDERAGSGPAATNTLMPPDECPSTPGGPINTDCRKPSQAERADLSVWLACEAKRGF